MTHDDLKSLIVDRLLPRVQTPGQYVGGELNSVVKDPARVEGRLCLAFPDAYAIGMSHHGLQVLYAVMNGRDDWACERVFTPLPDFERLLREHGLPLASLETFTPLGQFDVLGFTLQYDLSATNVLTMLDLGGIPLAAAERIDAHPLVIAGGPCAVNPEPMSRFIDAFVLGDGEAALPAVCDEWLRQRRAGAGREAALLELARRLPFVYVPRFYAPEPSAEGRPSAVRPTRPGVPETILPAVVEDLDAAPLPTAPVVPHVESVQDRIAVEIMRGCPGRCRFCQSTTLKRPLRFRRVETIVGAALESYWNTGYNEVSLLSLSTSDYPEFDALVRRMREVFEPLGVAVSLPSLRVNEQLRAVGELVTTERHSGLTLAPEAAREEMRRRIGKPIADEDLFEGCRRAFAAGFDRVKLYFMVGLPGEEQPDLDGIIDLADAVARIGRDVRGRWPTVVLNVSNFVPKPQTPFQWHAMRRRAYFEQARDHLRDALRRRRMHNVHLKHHDIDTSLLEGVLCRGDRRLGEVIEAAWRRGAKLDAWREHFRPEVWWDALAAARIDLERLLHEPRPTEASLPWDHVAIRQGRGHLEREREKEG